jgi:hypothetical protein
MHVESFRSWTHGRERTKDDLVKAGPLDLVPLIISTGRNFFRPEKAES